MKRLKIKKINKATGEYTEFITKPFSLNTPPYNRVVMDVVNHLHSLLDKEDDSIVVFETITLFEVKEGSLFDVY